jgi:hypothetical protein
MGSLSSGQMAKDLSDEDEEAEDRRLGAQAARVLYDHWDPEASFDRETSPGFAEAFTDEYSAMQKARAKSVDRVSSKRAGRSAVQLTEEAFRGILEVLQNAEDEEANFLTVALRRKGNRRELLFVHDGNRVKATTVVAMTSAYLSLKEGNARQIGKFGIGLKTLQRLGSELQVHCPPYHWAVVDGDAQRMEAAEPIPDLYEPDAGHTLMVLKLHGGVDKDDLYEWFRETDSETLLFLDHVRRMEYREMGRSPRAVKRALIDEKSRTYEIIVGRRSVTCTEMVLKAPREGEWRRYSIELPVGHHSRRSKLTGDTVPLCVAVPKAAKSGLLYSGLPTSERLGLPLHFGGPFEPDVSRERLDTGSAWNEWLLDEMRKFVQALAVRELEHAPRRAWSLIGKRADLEGFPDRWMTQQMRVFVDRQQQAMSQARIALSDEQVRLSDLVFEAPELAHILVEEDVEAIRPGAHCLSHEARDAAGRWRSVLLEMSANAQIGVAEALRLFDPDVALAKPAEWFVEFGAIAVADDEGQGLFERPSVLLADGNRATPCEGGEGSLLVSRSLAGTDLVARLSLAQQIHVAYTADTEGARSVRDFLVDRGAFSDEHSADAVLRALSGRKNEPVKLTDEDVAELAALIAKASEDVVKAIGSDLGLAVLVDGLEWVDGEKAYPPVSPAVAYLPAALDEKDGWAHAAGSTPGIMWVHPRYQKLFQQLDAPIGARKMFRRLGAEVAPRLEESGFRRHMYGESVFGMGWNAPELWRRQRESLRGRTGYYADALVEDKVSPDLIAVATDIATSRVNRDRRERARSLIRTLQRAWSRLYEDSAETTALYGYRHWRRLGPIATSFVAELADIDWLTDCERPSRPAAPVNLRIRSDGNATVYGDDPSAYAYELGPTDADNPVLVSIGVGGLPRASERLDALSALRQSGHKVKWSDVAHHYLGLSQVCPARVSSQAEVDDIVIADLASRFRDERLLWLGRWMSPTEVFRGEDLFSRDAAFVPEEPEYDRLWSALSIAVPRVPDCLKRLRAWEASGKTPAALGLSLLRTYRAVANGLSQTNGRTKKDLKALPVWTGVSWTSTRPVYYSDSEVFSSTLSKSDLPVWSVPGPLHTLRDLPDALGLQRVSPSDFAVSNRGGTNSVYDLMTAESFAQAVLLTREFIAQSMPDVDSRIADASWEALESASVELVPGLTLLGTLGGKRVTLEASLHLDRNEMRFYFEHPAQIGRRDEGGALIADAFDLDSSDRLSISLAWVASWQRALEGDAQLLFPTLRRTPEYVDGAAVPDAPEPLPAGVRRQKKQTKSAQRSDAASSRKLKDIESMIVSSSRPASAPPKGAVETSSPGTRVEKRRGAKPSDPARSGTGRRAPEYSSPDRERAGLSALAKVLGRVNVEIEDTTGQAVGADAIGTDGRYYELKVHGGVASGGLRLQPSEVLQARQLGEEYVLVVVENVEDSGANTRVTLIPNPLGVLTIWPMDRVEVTGYDDKSFERHELA